MTYSIDHPRFPTLAISLITLAVLSVSGCAVTPPSALNTHDLLKQDQQDRLAMFAGQEPLNGPLTLDEAIARAVKYNLQQRLGLMERALEDDLVTVQQLSMLPKLTAQAGLRTRDNYAASSSESLRTGRQSLEPSFSQQRTTESASLQLSWNVLDFGLSYFGAKAQGNKALAAEERRRRVVADIIRQTRSAYWTAVTAERLKTRLGTVLAETRLALELSRQTEQKRLVAPLLALRYQRDLLTMVRQLETLDAELALAKSRLASLMNLPPASPLELAAITDADMVAPALPYEVEKLEILAMTQRPELREEGYQARNAVLETRMALLKLLPNLSLYGGGNYDSNKYLTNNHWADAGIQVSGNLLNVLSWPAIERSAEKREKVADLRRQALRMTVLTQVNVAWLERQRAERLFERATELSRLQEAIQQQTENASRSQSETQLELVRSRVEALLATRARDLAYAELLNAQGTVYQAAGIDPLPAQVDDLTIAGLARSIAQVHAQIDQGRLAIPTPLPSTDGSTVISALTVEQVSPAQPETPVTPVLPTLRVVNGNRWSSLGSLSSAGEQDAR